MQVRVWLVSSFFEEASGLLVGQDSHRAVTGLATKMRVVLCQPAGVGCDPSTT